MRTTFVHEAEDEAGWREAEAEANNFGLEATLATRI